MCVCVCGVWVECVWSVELWSNRCSFWLNAVHICGVVAVALVNFHI